MTNDLTGSSGDVVLAQTPPVEEESSGVELLAGETVGREIEGEVASEEEAVVRKETAGGGAETTQGDAVGEEPMGGAMASLQIVEAKQGDHTEKEPVQESPALMETGSQVPANVGVQSSSPAGGSTHVQTQPRNVSESRSYAKVPYSLYDFSFQKLAVSIQNFNNPSIPLNEEDHHKARLTMIKDWSGMYESAIATFISNLTCPRCKKIPLGDQDQDQHTVSQATNYLRARLFRLVQIQDPSKLWEKELDCAKEDFYHLESLYLADDSSSACQGLQDLRENLVVYREVLSVQDYSADADEHQAHQYVRYDFHLNMDKIGSVQSVVDSTPTAAEDRWKGIMQGAMTTWQKNMQCLKCGKYPGDFGLHIYPQRAAWGLTDIQIGWESASKKRMNAERLDVIRGSLQLAEELYLDANYRHNHFRGERCNGLDNLRKNISHILPGTSIATE